MTKKNSTSALKIIYFGPYGGITNESLEVVNNWLERFKNDIIVEKTTYLRSDVGYLMGVIIDYRDVI